LVEGRVRDEERTAEDAALDEAEAQLPGFLAVDIDDSEDDEDYTPTISSPELLMMTRKALHVIQLLLHQLQPLRCLS